MRREEHGEEGREEHVRRGWMDRKTDIPLSIILS